MKTILYVLLAIALSAFVTYSLVQGEASAKKSEAAAIQGCVQGGGTPKFAYWRGREEFHLESCTFANAGAEHP